MQIEQSLKAVAADARLLIARLLNSPYPFALWRKPDGQERFLIVSLKTTEQKNQSENNVWELENISDSFVFNTFEASHPAQPEIIHADISIKLDPAQQIHIQYNPAISASKIEEFVSTIRSTESIQFQSGISKLGETCQSEYEKYTQKAVDLIAAGKLQKVVTSRYREVQLPENFDAYSFFSQLCDRYSAAFCYLAKTVDHGTWTGATPERLMTIEKERYFTTDALAGTQTLPEGMPLKEIAWKQKEIEEQAMVSRYIISCLKKIRLREFDEIGPRTVQAGNLTHLRTTFHIDMEATNSPQLGSTMVDLLHPTSAVCGFPRKEAFEFIQENESYSRGLFSGFLGPVNFQQATRLFVNLRCMQLHTDKATLYAGAGITEDSDPTKEYEETGHKMNTMLSVLHKQ